MKDKRNLVVKHSNVQRLADLAGIMNDLRLTVLACDLFLAHPNIGSQEIILRSKAIASFAILTYFRTLANGVRSGITTEQISRLSQKHTDTHHYLKNVRDQYLAHSVNNQEENLVEVMFTEDGSGIEELSTSHTRPATFKNEDISSLRELTESLMQIVDEEWETEFDLAWDFVESLTEDERKKFLSEHRPARTTSYLQSKRRKLSG